GALPRWRCRGPGRLCPRRRPDARRPRKHVRAGARRLAPRDAQSRHHQRGGHRSFTRADGKALMKFVMHFVPYRVTGDARGRISDTNWDEIKEIYADAMIDFISETYLPGLRGRIIARSVQSPVDLERRIKSAVHGTHQHGAYLPYQIGSMRPIPELGSYRSP